MNVCPNELLDAALNCLSDHIAIIDEAGVICYVNQAWIDFGVANECLTPPPEWVGINYLQVCDTGAQSGDEYGALVSNLIRHVMTASIESAYLDYPCHSPTEKRWYLMRVQRLRWNGPARFLITHGNITNSKLIELSLADHESRLREIIDHTMAGIVTFDEHGLIEMFNPAAERVFGYDATEVIGRNVRTLIPELHEIDHHDTLFPHCQTEHAKIVGIEREVVGLRKNGATFPLYLAVNEICQDNRRTFVGLVRDMSNRHEVIAKVA